MSRFKATCLAVLEQVRKTGRPVLITKRGKALAEIVPVTRPREGKRRLGLMAERGAILGDVVEPIVGTDEWESLGS